MAEQSTNNPPRHLTSPNATIHSIYVPVTKLDRYEQCTDPAHRLRGTHLTIDDGFPYADKQAEENMEIVVESYFRAHVATMGPNSGPEHPFRAFNVLVDESFLPDPTLQCGGFISQVTSLYTEGTTHADNRWRMYTILCHAEDLGLVILHEDEVNIATRTERTQGWDEDLKCDQNFKKIYNAVVDYYLENPGRMRTRFTCPVLHPPAEKGEILRCFLAEVETRDWLQQSKKYSQEGN